MAAYSTDLFELIRSMSATEKAYFKRYGYKNGSRRKDYLKLFDALEKQKVYGEPALRKKYEGNGGFRSLSAAKNHLFHQVLSSLIEYNANKTAEDQVIRQLQEVWFLRNRGMDKACSKRLNSTWKTIQATGLQVFSPGLFPVESALIPYTEAGYQERFESLDRELGNLRDLQNLTEIRTLYAKMTQIVTTWGVIVRDPRHIAAVEELLAHPLLKDEGLARMFEAKSMLHGINKILNQVICRYDVALVHARKAVELHERTPELPQRYQRSYLMALFNMLNDLVGAGQFGEFDALKDRIGTYISQMPDSEFKIESEANLTCRIVYKEMLERNYQTSWLASESLKKGLRHFDFQPHLNVQHRYLIACANFYTGRTEEAQTWVADLLSDPHLESFRDYLAFSLMLNLIIHLELGNREHLAHARERVQKVFSKREILFELEQVFLAFLKGFERLPDDQTLRKQAFIELRDQLQPLREDPFERNAFDYFDFEIWLEARINNITMEVAAARWKKNRITKN